MSFNIWRKRLFKRFARKSKLHQLLNKKIYRFSPTGDWFTLADAVEGVSITGAIGSGKTSGPGTHLFLAYLRAMMGGLCLVVKSDEADRLIKLVKKAGREKDLIIFSKDSHLSFNFLEYELKRVGGGASEIGNLVNLLMMIYQTGKQYKASSQSESNDKFWDDELERALRSTIQLLILAKVQVTIANMRKIIVHAFTEKDYNRYKEIWKGLEDEDTTDERRKELWSEYEAWVEENFFLYCFEKANSRTDLSEYELDTFQILGDYWLRNWPDQSEKTTSIVVAMFHAVVDPFLDGILRSHFTKGVSEELLPEQSYLEGKIIICDFPVKEYHLSGIYAASIMKLIWQQAMERRRVETEENPRPVMLFIDEAQNLINGVYDTQFQLTARSSLVASIYIYQTINAIKMVMGKYAANEKAMALLGNLNTKIFCNNSCVHTNSWGSNLIGEHNIDTITSSVGGRSENGHTYNQTRRRKVSAEYFGTLKTGGAKNKYLVTAIVYKAGRIWRSGHNFFEAKFNQIV